mmetsp:Transcript_16211/g.46138  ORF Transcript_16211/g.46138 Transcript_16211/m.46138 type:complete len:118 (-) Transcript_16211:263-616(-)
MNAPPTDTCIDLRSYIPKLADFYGSLFLAGRPADTEEYLSVGCMILVSQLCAIHPSIHHVTCMCGGMYEWGGQGVVCIREKARKPVCMFSAQHTLPYVCLSVLLLCVWFVQTQVDSE